MNEAPLPCNASIYIAGHQGLVGSAIVRKLKGLGYTNLITQPFKHLDLRNQQQTEQFFLQTKPDYVICAAARVGGIQANIQEPASFIYDNLAIATNVIHASYQAKIKKLIFLGSSCIYPRLAPQPIKEEHLLTGPLENTNEAYALAKIAGIGLCKAYNKQYNTQFISVMPTNLYGPGDTFSQTQSHVMPALIQRIHSAHITNQPSVTIWGSGKVLREFLHVDDCADGIIHVLNTQANDDIINIGSGHECSIETLARLIKTCVGYKGELIFDRNKPEGTPRKLLDSSKINALGWHAKISLEDGLRQTIDWYRNTLNPTTVIAHSVQKHL